MKSKLPETEYKNSCPTGSIPGKLYGTVKVHKMKRNDVNELLSRPIISNVRNSIVQTYETSSKIIATSCTVRIYCIIDKTLTSSEQRNLSLY